MSRSRGVRDVRKMAVKRDLPLFRTRIYLPELPFRGRRTNQRHTACLIKAWSLPVAHMRTRVIPRPGRIYLPSPDDSHTTPFIIFSIRRFVNHEYRVIDVTDTEIAVSNLIKDFILYKETETGNETD